MKEISEIHQSKKSVMQTKYDIVKAHGGEIKINSNQAEGAEFIIQLPIEQVFKNV